MRIILLCDIVIIAVSFTFLVAAMKQVGLAAAVNLVGGIFFITLGARLLWLDYQRLKDQ